MTRQRLLGARSGIGISRQCLNSGGAWVTCAIDKEFGSRESGSEFSFERQENAASAECVVISCARWSARTRELYMLIGMEMYSTQAECLREVRCCQGEPSHCFREPTASGRKNLAGAL